MERWNYFFEWWSNHMYESSANRRYQILPKRGLVYDITVDGLAPSVVGSSQATHRLWVPERLEFNWRCVSVSYNSSWCENIHIKNVVIIGSAIKIVRTQCVFFHDTADKQRVLTPGHQGWNDLHSLCRIGMEYYLLNNDDNNIIYWIMVIIIIMMMIIVMIIMMIMIIGTTTIMIMIIIITTTLTMTIMKMIMIKTAQTPCQSLYKDRRIQNKIAWYNRDDVMLILYEMLHTCSVMHTQRRCKFENTKHRCLGVFLHKCNLHCSGRN